MHPAYSIIFFTTASGAGYGLIACAVLFGVSGLVPVERPFGIGLLGVASALVIGGLLSSVAHLRRPERAWRAFSQWRSSWLSREAVLAVATFVPLTVFGFGWMMHERLWLVPGLLAAASALATVHATAMIYRSVRPVRAWSSPLVSAAFLTFAIAGGTFLAATIVTVLGRAAPIVTFVAILATITAWAIKVTYWRAIDRPDPTSTRETALGLQGRGRVTPLEPAHSHPNYLLEEMGYVVARRHASKLRRIALAGAASALALLLTALAVGPGMIATPIVLLATGTYFAAVLIERWLFFAEARHTVLLYYGAG